MQPICWLGVIFIEAVLALLLWVAYLKLTGYERQVAELRKGSSQTFDTLYDTIVEIKGSVRDSEKALDAAMSFGGWKQKAFWWLLLRVTGR